MKRATLAALSASFPRWARCTRAICRSCKQPLTHPSPVIVSIFVNPKQFGPAEDYAKYPRSLEADSAALENKGVDFLFAPPVEEMYPAGFATTVSVAGMGERLEGRVRPGHFNGVSTVVLKLFEITAPRFAFFGRKDAQQMQLLRRMARDLALDTEIVSCPIVREPDGLALSSRNFYLSARERMAATVLHRALDSVRAAVASGERDGARLKAIAKGVLVSEPLAASDYVELVDADSFEPITRVRKTCYVVVAARIGTTRLIDNLFVDATEIGGGVAAPVTCSL